MADRDIVRAASHLDHCNYNLIIIQMRLAACACETPDTISTFLAHVDVSKTQTVRRMWPFLL